jgi:hypothetical protein
MALRAVRAGLPAEIENGARAGRYQCIRQSAAKPFAYL